MTWTRATVRSELLKVLVEHAGSEANVSESSHIVADLGIDSLGVMEIMEAIEDTFKLTIPDDSLREVETVADFVKVVEERLAANGRLEG